MDIKGNLNLWLRIGRGYTLPQSIVPYIFAVVLASKQCSVNLFLSALGLFGVVLVHASVNMLDDYFDWKKGAVKEYKKLLDSGMQARTHKCFYLEEKLITEKQLLVVALLYDAIACFIGFYIASKVGVSVIFIAALAGLMGFFYSAPPLKLSYRGLGEFAIAIIFGPLLMIGAYITAGATPDKPILFASVILGLLISNIASTHAIMDFDSDVKANKISFATLFKTKENAVIALGGIYVIAYLLLAIAIVLRIYPLASILVFITAPKTVALIKLMNSPSKQKKWWMGAIENWKEYEKEGSAWFMMRLNLSRNILLDFIILLGVTFYLFG